jgi:hypothetical protein
MSAEIASVFPPPPPYTNNNNTNNNNNNDDDSGEGGGGDVNKNNNNHRIDIRSLGVGRSMDLFMYVLYSGDEVFIQNMVNRVVHEVAIEEECAEMEDVLLNADNRLMYKCLFFVMVDFHAKFRYWALSENTSMGLQPICPQKALRFLKSLRDDIVPSFLVNETMRMDDFERKIKVEYIRS